MKSLIIQIEAQTKELGHLTILATQKGLAGKDIKLIQAIYSLYPEGFLLAPNYDKEQIIANLAGEINMGYLNVLITRLTKDNVLIKTGKLCCLSPDFINAARAEQLVFRVKEA